jgi:hypothetical protein
MNFLTWNPLRKFHPAAFSGTAICPYCYGTKVSLVERITPTVYRWRCKGCSFTFREDVSPVGEHSDDPRAKEHWVNPNPYATFKQGLRPAWQIQKHRYSKNPKQSTPETDSGG